MQGDKGDGAGAGVGLRLRVGVGGDNSRVEIGARRGERRAYRVWI